MLSDKTFIDIAYVISKAGTCERLKVGAVIVRDRRIISTGYNGAPRGMPHCDHSQDDERYKALTGGGCMVSVHAEANAICFAAKEGISTDKASLYTTDAPCIKCAELIVNAGIIEVIYERPYRDSAGLELLSKALIHIGHFDGSEVRTVPASRGDGEGLYSSQHADPSFDEAWTREHEGKHQAGGNW